jgi:hypothetical protein
VALDLGGVMDAIGVRLATIPGLRVHDYQADGASPPAAIVGLPEVVEYDTVAGRGADRVVVPVLVLVGRVSDRAARDAIAPYVSGAGAKSVKTAVESGNSDLAGAAHTVRVTMARIDIVTIQAVDYLGASFDVEVYD